MSTSNAGLAKKLGYTNVRVFLAGEPAWSEEGYPVYASKGFVEKGNIVLIDLRSAATLDVAVSVVEAEPYAAVAFYNQVAIDVLCANAAGIVIGGCALAGIADIDTVRTVLGIDKADSEHRQYNQSAHFGSSRRRNVAI